MKIAYSICRIIKKVQNLTVLIKLWYYKKIMLFECKNCGENPRVFSPISLKGLKYFTIGDNFKLDYHSIFEAWDWHNNISYKPNILIGNNVSIGKRCHLGCINTIIIEDNVLIGSDVMIMDHNHGKSDYSDISIPPNKRCLSSKGSIHICKNVWIGEKACILPGVTIGENAIVGANTVITHDVPDNCVVCGIPAKVIRTM